MAPSEVFIYNPEKVEVYESALILMVFMKASVVTSCRGAAVATPA